MIIEGRANVLETLDEDEYYYIIPDDNYVLKHKGDTVTLIDGGVEVARKITREEFNEGVKRLAQGNMKSKRGD